MKQRNSSVFCPILVLGAGRSGTKLLRSILASHVETASFPREINYIWRHGNASFPTDELRPEHARSDVVDYIHKRFMRFKARIGCDRLVEKTCANVLRVDFVHRIFPEAVIIHLVRDGRAVAESARRRWLAKPDLSYLLEKLRWVPLEDILYYGVRYLSYQVGRLGGTNKGAQLSWGPRFEGIDWLVNEKKLIEVCGIQWKRCVQSAEDAVEGLPSHQVIKVRYEDLVMDPLSVSQSLFEKVGLKFTNESYNFVVENVSQEYMDRWRDKLSANDLSLLMPHIKDSLLNQGYEL